MKRRTKCNQANDTLLPFASLLCRSVGDDVDSKVTAAATALRASFLLFVFSRLLASRSARMLDFD
jgi:hypothetical protein